MRLRAISAVLVPALAVLGCAGAPTYNWKAENALGYRIGPGDQLKVIVWKHDELSTQVAVRPDGAISLPLVGDVPRDRSQRERDRGRRPDAPASLLPGRPARHPPGARREVLQYLRRG